MARFYGGVRGSRGEATRCGTYMSGLTAFAHGWHIGARVLCFKSPHDDSDRVIVTIDGGTNGSCQEIVLGPWKWSNGALVLDEQHCGGALFGTWRIVNGQLVLEAA